MTLARYRIVPHADQWVVRHDEDVTGPYETKAAAFEAAVATAEVAIAEGYAVEVTVPASVENRWIEFESRLGPGASAPSTTEMRPARARLS